MTVMRIIFTMGIYTIRTVTMLTSIKSASAGKTPQRVRRITIAVDTRKATSTGLIADTKQFRTATTPTIWCKVISTMRMAIIATITALWKRRRAHGNLY
jgi:hypothetical protein